MFFPSKNPRIEVTVILLAYYIYFWLSTLARTREVSSAMGPSVSMYPTDTHISSGWSLLTDYVAEFDRPCFPANRHASREYSSSDLLSGARALLTSLSSLSASASAWLTTSRCERTLGDAPNAGDFVRRKITFLGRRTRKPFLSLSLSLSLPLILLRFPSFFSFFRSRRKTRLIRTIRKVSRHSVSCQRSPETSFGETSNSKPCNERILSLGSYQRTLS